MQGIKFNAQGIKAITEGRKTMTRRPIKDNGNAFRILETFDSSREYSIGALINEYSKYKIGETVFVQEEFYFDDEDYGLPLYYSLDDAKLKIQEYEGYSCICDENCVYNADQMQEHQSRIFLKITDTKVERLQDISSHDCKAEGVEFQTHKFRYRELFEKEIWNNLPYKAPHDWKSNPYVFVYEFEVVK